MCLLAFSLYPYVRLYDLAGRGAQILRGNHKRGARSAPSSLILSPLLRFPLRLSFLISPLSWDAPHPFVCWAFSALRIVSFMHCEWGHLPINHDSLFTIHHSLFTEIRVTGLLSAGFSIGRKHAAEAALAACASLIGRAPLTVPGGKWRRALPARRESAVGLADPRAPRRSRFSGVC